ncbi:MAG: C25 family cysteine peptidase [Candidatus Thermoplasmatota archaeon]
MKKILPLILVGMLVFAGLGVRANIDETSKNLCVTMVTSQPNVVDKGEYIVLELPETTSYVLDAGKPMMPKQVHVFDIPFGSTNIQVSCVPTDISEMYVTKEIIPSPQPLPLLPDVEVGNEDIKDMQVYTSSELYPSCWYDYQTTAGLDGSGNHVIHVAIHTYPVRYAPLLGKIVTSKTMTISVSYTPPNTPILFGDTYDLVIIAPSRFSRALQPLVKHKNDMGMRTIFKTTEWIYTKYQGFDKPEKIKHFIKDALGPEGLNWGIRYVLLVGGLKNHLFTNDRENNSTGTKAWHVPVRYTNLYESYNSHQPPSSSNVYDPGYVSDLYYADVYNANGSFSTWDTNKDRTYAVWGKSGFARDTLDLDPDVAVGRLACRNTLEVKQVVKKIITYEKKTAGQEWFKKMVVIAGDGFQDQADFGISWDVNSLPTGRYTIYAQSKNIDDVAGPVDIINVTVDKSVASKVTFNEDDHLKIDKYPALPIAEITSPSEGDILGNTNVDKIPEKAYIGSRWAKIRYINGVMEIKGKSYDPRPDGVVTTLHVVIKASNGSVVFEAEKSFEMYFEDEHETKLAMSYMPNDFTKEVLWSSNGKFTSQDDVISALSAGSGFVYFSGHGSPRVWANHYPGIPGGRANSSIVGLSSFDIKKAPYFPMSKLTNGNKLPVLLVGGCHNSQFNISLIKTLNLTDKFGPFAASDIAGYWTHGVPTYEAWSWAPVQSSKGGAIATIGCTGLGYGYLGVGCTQGLGGWINPQFFKITGQKIDASQPLILGDIYRQTLSNYITTFPVKRELEDCKTVQEWILLGDPSLMIGGYTT